MAPIVCRSHLSRFEMRRGHPPQSCIYEGRSFFRIRLGDYPTLPLAEARSRARETVAAIVDHKAVARPASNVASFGDVVEQYIETRLPFTAKALKSGQPRRKNRLCGESCRGRCSLAPPTRSGMMTSRNC
jgi:hypothetical protein